MLSFKFHTKFTHSMPIPFSPSLFNQKPRPAFPRGVPLTCRNSTLPFTWLRARFKSICFNSPWIFSHSMYSYAMTVSWKQIHGIFGWRQSIIEKMELPSLLSFLRMFACITVAFLSPSKRKVPSPEKAM